MNTTAKQTAYLHNQFAQHAQLGFRQSRQMRLLVALLSQINPMEGNLSGLISMREMAALMKGTDAKRSGSWHRDMRQVVAKMMEKNIAHFAVAPLLGDQGLTKDIPIFDTLQEEKAADGSTWYRYVFHEAMRPYLQELKGNFTRINVPLGIKSGAAIRLFLWLKAQHDKQQAHRHQTTLKVDLDDLKKLLGMADKYRQFKNFRRRVLLPAIKAINAAGQLFVADLRCLKRGRSVGALEFEVQTVVQAKIEAQARLVQPTIIAPKLQKEPIALSVQKPFIAPQSGNRALKGDYVPTDKEISQLSFSKLKAFRFLIQKGCKEGIVYRHILPKIAWSEYIGWEDVFAKKAWGIFMKKTRHTEVSNQIGAFVKWLLQEETRTQLLSDLLESVREVKKAKTQEERDNRQMAKEMTNAEFVQWYRAKQERLQQKGALNDRLSLLSDRFSADSPPKKG